MRAAGLRGIPRKKTRRTTCSTGAETPRPADKVNRQFVAAAPNRLWVADLTYIRTWSGWVYAAFVLDVYSRRVVVIRSRPACAPISPSTPSRWACGPGSGPAQDVTGLVHHSDRGVQYRAVRYTERLADRGRRLCWQQG